MYRTLIVVALLLAGCSLKNPSVGLTPYKIDIQQGNPVTQEMLDQLRPGMTLAQVRFLLGTPLIVDPFREDRWDYIYRLERGGKAQEQRRITVVFENGRFKGLQGDVSPAGVDRRPTPSESNEP